MTKDGVILKWKRITDARKDRIMERLVAKPLRILSEYLITTAVISPPKTWIETVAHAQPPKFLSKLAMKPRELGTGGPYNTGRNAGTSEKRDSWTLRTHKSAFEFLSTISKYTPARPEVKQAAVTAPNPLRGLMICV